jgi:hypothetical protein
MPPIYTILLRKGKYILYIHTHTTRGQTKTSKKQGKKKKRKKEKKNGT